MKIRFYNANIVVFNDNENIVFGEVCVEDGIITYVGKNRDLKEVYDREIDVEGNILMPGFINSHAHTPMCILRGIKDDVNLNDWLFDNILPLEAKLNENDIYWAMMLGMAEYVRGGITCFDEGYFLTKAQMKAIAKAKMRARLSIGDVKIGEVKSREEIYNEDMEELAKIDSLIKPVCFAHSIYTVTTEELIDVCNYSKKYNIDRAIHLSETLKEVGDCSVKYNKTPVEYLEDLGYFDRQCSCYHCVHMDKDDIQILADYGVSVVTCPASNLKLGSGIAPITTMLNKGINVAIGTDGVASNNNADMFKEMYLVANLQKGILYKPENIKAIDAIKMATKNGAISLGYDNLGEIKEGYLADLILVSTKEPHWNPINDYISSIVYAAKSSDVYLTMVNGNILYENGKYNIGEDINETISKVAQIAKEIKTR